MKVNEFLETRSKLGTIFQTYIVISVIKSVFNIIRSK